LAKDHETNDKGMNITDGRPSPSHASHLLIRKRGDSGDTVQGLIEPVACIMDSPKIIGFY